MYRFSKNGVTVLTVLDRRRQKNNGLYPVKIEVIYKRRQKYYPAWQDVTVEEWETMWTSRRIHHKATEIERSFNMIRSTVETLADKGRFCFSALEYRIGRTDLSVNDAIRRKMRALQDEGRVNSFYRYRSMLQALEEFKGGRIAFDDVDARWLKRCEEKWVNNGRNNTTINIYMKSLRSIFKEAVEDGVITESQCPFGKNGYKIPASLRRTMALSKEDIKMIINWKGDEEAEYWRDLWVFSYLCNGINFRDMLFLRYGNISDGEIRFVRSKTSSYSSSKVISAPLMPLMNEIMERRGNGTTGPADRLIFKHAKGNEDPFKIAKIVRVAIISCNKALKIIAEDIGIQNFTTYSARHSFATVLKRNGVDLQYISESLGHSSLRMTENYLAGFEKEDRIKNSKVLTDFS